MFFLIFVYFFCIYNFLIIFYGGKFLNWFKLNRFYGGGLLVVDENLFGGGGGGGENYDGFWKVGFVNKLLKLIWEVLVFRLVRGDDFWDGCCDGFRELDVVLGLVFWLVCCLLIFFKRFFICVIEIVSVRILRGRGVYI